MAAIYKSTRNDRTYHNTLQYYHTTPIDCSTVSLMRIYNLYWPQTLSDHRCHLVKSIDEKRAVVQTVGPKVEFWPRAAAMQLPGPPKESRTRCPKKRL